MNDLNKLYFLDFVQRQCFSLYWKGLFSLKKSGLYANSQILIKFLN